MLKQKLEEKGHIIHGCVEFFKCEVQPMISARDHMFDDFTHSVDTARWICGGNVTNISSTCKNIETPDLNWITANLEFDTGSNCIITNSWVSGRRIFRVQMHSNCMKKTSRPCWSSLHVAARELKCIFFF